MYETTKWNNFRTATGSHRHGEWLSAELLHMSHLRMGFSTSELPFRILQICQREQTTESEVEKVIRGSASAIRKMESLDDFRPRRILI